ncbi:MAG: prolipoprotein diacylglyceryl transferase [Thermoguttaceae bacterium]|nr:prolipoprotein diacylglyceryl transferase [Thermoguttaceae bacterium]
MCETFLWIPEKIGSIPLFGFGLVTIGWLLAMGAWLGWSCRQKGWTTDARSSLLFMLVIAFVFWKVFPFLAIPGRGVPIRGYGTMMLIGVLSGGGLAIWRARRMHIAPQTLIDLLLWGILPGLIGGRIWHVVQYWPIMKRDNLVDTFISVINVPGGGLVMYGALIGALAGWTFFIWRHQMPLLRMLDIVAPGMLLGLAFGRIGCFMFGCCFGGPSELPWAVQFPAGTLPWESQIDAGLLPVHGLTLETSDHADGDCANGNCALNHDHASHDHAEEAVRIRSVAPGSAAEAAGAKPGMQILAADQYQVLHRQQFLQWLVARPVGETIHLLVMPEPPARLARTTDAPNTESGAESKVSNSQSVESDGTNTSTSEMKPGESLPSLASVADSLQPVMLEWAAEALPAKSLPVHPTQLYQSIDAFILCFLILALTPYCRRDGMQLAATLTVYPISRFLLELIRVDEKGQFGTSLSIGQWTSLVIFVAALCLWVYIGFFERDENERTPA